jgi:hypothetical protein
MDEGLLDIFNSEIYSSKDNVIMDKTKVLPLRNR